MPPQPLSKVYPKAFIRIAPALALANREMLAPKVLSVIAWGAQDEWLWANILTMLLKGDPEAGMAMYEALSGSEARRAALLAAGKVRLPPDDFLMLQAVQRAIAPARRLRNKFAHHLWADSEHLPDALLLIPPEVMTKAGVSWVKGSPDDLDYSRIQVWKDRALSEACATARKANESLHFLKAGIEFTPDRGAITDGMRQRLLLQPGVAQARQQLSPQNSQKVPP
jgi:hypothetical protein